MPKPTGDLITHCNSVRSRIIGSGQLVTVLSDTVGNSQLLANATLTEITGQSITQIANFRGERVAYDIRVVNIDEWFKVSNQYAYVKATAASYPLL